MVVCNHGFSPAFREIIDLIKSYIKKNKLEKWIYLLHYLDIAKFQNTTHMLARAYTGEKVRY